MSCCKLTMLAVFAFCVIAVTADKAEDSDVPRQERSYQRVIGTNTYNPNPFIINNRNRGRISQISGRVDFVVPGNVVFPACAGYWVCETGQGQIIGGSSVIVGGGTGSRIVSGNYGGRSRIISGNYGGGSRVITGNYGGNSRVITGNYGSGSRIISGGSRIISGNYGGGRKVVGGNYKQKRGGNYGGGGQIFNCPGCNGGGIPPVTTGGAACRCMMGNCQINCGGGKIY